MTTTEQKPTVATFETPAAFRRFAAATSTDETRDVIRTPCAYHGVFFATDGRRLHALDFGNAPPDSDVKGAFTVPKKLKGNCALTIQDGAPASFFDGERLPARETGTVPNVRAVIPDPDRSAGTITADLSTWLEALKSFRDSPLLSMRAILSSEGLALRATWDREQTLWSVPAAPSLPPASTAPGALDFPETFLAFAFLKDALAFLADHCSQVTIRAHSNTATEYSKESPGPVVIEPARAGNYDPTPAPLAVIMPASG